MDLKYESVISHKVYICDLKEIYISVRKCAMNMF